MANVEDMIKEAEAGLESVRIKLHSSQSTPHENAMAQVAYIQAQALTAIARTLWRIQSKSFS